MENFSAVKLFLYTGIKSNIIPVQYTEQGKKFEIEREKQERKLGKIKLKTLEYSKDHL